MSLNYDEYMKSRRWFDRRDAFFAKYRARCGCGSRFDLELHHKTYLRLGNERDEDLVPLCENCHKRVHSEAERLQVGGKMSKWEALAEASKYLIAELGPSDPPESFYLPPLRFADCRPHPVDEKCGYCDAVEDVTGRRPTPWMPLPEARWTDEETPDFSVLAQMRAG
ncbi:MAG: HNH endonuclease [Gemmatimonadaceae bacterium]|nr:HNH endonuclease [Gemmatimonadaceae bacterium]